VEKTILMLISIIATINSKSLRVASDGVTHFHEKELDPDTVKSPGGFENVAPDAKKIITASYAQPKMNINLRVSTLSVVQRNEKLGHTELPKIGRVFDPSTRTFDTVPFVDHKVLHATTTTWAPTENFHTVQMDIKSAKHIDPLITANQPKAVHGVNSV